MQFSTFRMLGDTDTSCHTLMASGNVRSATSAAFRWVTSREAAAAHLAGRFTSIIAAFSAAANAAGASATTADRSRATGTATG